MSEELNEQMQVRNDKRATYLEKGIDPFGGKFERTHAAEGLHKLFEDRKSVV